jgi:iron complex transport system substrate-binding protein
MKRRQRHVLAALCALATLSSAQPSQADAPRRIVSFNLCADQLVVALADPGQIAGLSPYAANPGLSVVAEQAKPYPRLDWDAEATVAFAPDVVFVGPSHRTIMQHMLRSLGLRLVEVELITDIAAARTQIEQMAALLGHPERGDALVARLDRARQRLAAIPRPPLKTALVIERGGYTAGPASLAAALVAEAGFQPPAGTPDGYGGYVPLERLLMLRPDLLVLKDPPVEAGDQGALFFTHPAVRALYPPERRIALPSRYTLCGGPALVAALDYLADVLTALAQR